MNAVVPQPTARLGFEKEPAMKNTVDKSLWGGAAHFDDLLNQIRECRSEHETQGYISLEIVEQFKEIGIYRAFVPEKFGGDGKTPAEFLLAIEAIAAADGSAGWVASFGMNPAYLAGLPESTLQLIWEKGPDIVFAGCAYPPQEVEIVEGGYIVSGRWPYGSGCMGASLFGVSIKVPGTGPLPHMAVLLADKVQIDQNTWGVHGMASTGSYDLVVDKVFVEKDWVFERGGKPSIDTDFLRYPSLSIAAQVLSVTTAGVAREALDMVIAMGENQSITGAPSIGDREYAQIDIAKAEAKLRASRAFFYESVHQAWNSVVNGGKATPEQISMLRLSTSNLTHECSEVVRTAYRIGGMASTYYENHLSRCFRDSNMPTQHAMMNEITFRNAGAMMFGREPLPGYL